MKTQNQKRTSVQNRKAGAEQCRDGWTALQEMFSRSFLLLHLSCSTTPPESFWFARERKREREKKRANLLFETVLYTLNFSFFVEEKIYCITFS